MENPLVKEFMSQVGLQNLTGTENPILTEAMKVVEAVKNNQLTVKEAENKLVETFQQTPLAA